MRKYKFEICTNSVESCLAAQQGGADRVELCAGIPEGGTTPSYGEIVVARELLHIKLHVIIRPRGGDFLYSPLEIKTMLRDIEMVKKAGADGVVLGCLTPNGEVDMPLMKELVAAADSFIKRTPETSCRTDHPTCRLWCKRKKHSTYCLRNRN